VTGARPDTWMPFYVGDYLRDTMDLTTTEHGCYLLLIAHYWVTGGPLNNDLSRLAIASRFEPEDTKIVAFILGRFFTLKGDAWHHKRIDRELARSRHITNERKKAGKTGGCARGMREANGKQTGSNCLQIAQANAKQKAIPSQPQLQKEEESKIPPETRARATTIPGDWQPSPATRQWCALKCFTEQEVSDETEHYRNHYLSTADTRADWDAGFRSWLAKSKQFQRSRTVGSVPGKGAGHEPDGFVAAVRSVIGS